MLTPTCNTLCGKNQIPLACRNRVDRLAIMQEEL
jgi:hypothetical protein